MAVTIHPEISYEIVSQPNNNTSDYYLYYDTSQPYINQTQSQEPDTFSQVISILIPILFGIIAVVGCFGNLLVIIVVWKNKQMWNSTNILIINLALADLCFIVICVPFTAVSYVIPIWPFGFQFCRFYQYMINVTAYMSVYTLVMMSIDRYLAVCHPIWSINWRNDRNALVVILLSWVVILLVTAPIIFEYDVVEVAGSQICVHKKIVEDDLMKRTPYHGRVFYTTFFIFGYVLPLTTVVVLYSFLVKRLFQKTQGQNESVEKSRAKKRVTTMVTVVVFIFALSWLPMHIRFMIQYFGKHYDNPAFQIYQVIASCLAYCNSCVNPILYAFLSENFRKSFRKVICCYSKFQQMRIDYERTHIPMRTYATNADNDCCNNVLEKPDIGNDAAVKNGQLLPKNSALQIDE